MQEELSISNYLFIKILNKTVANGDKISDFNHFGGVCGENVTSCGFSAQKFVTSISYFYTVVDLWAHTHFISASFWNRNKLV